MESTINMLESLKIDQLEARKARNIEKANLLGTIIAEATRNEKDPSNEQVLKAIRKVHTGVVEMLQHSPNSETAQYERDLLEGYLPKMLSAEELSKAFAALVASEALEISMKNMKTFKEKLEVAYPGAVDGKMLAEIIKSKISA